MKYHPNRRRKGAAMRASMPRMADAWPPIFGGLAPEDRLRLLAVALAWEGRSAQRFAREIVGVTYSHLYQVLRGDRSSPRVMGVVAGYVREHASELCRYLTESLPDASEDRPALAA